MNSWFKPALVSSVILAAFLLLSSPVQAHRVIVYSWVEGNQVITNSRFSNQRPVVGGEISVFDSNSNRLLGGKTDDQGEFSFEVPGKGPLKILLKAGPGHMAKWMVSEAELLMASKSHHHQGMEEGAAASGSIYNGGCQQAEIEAVIDASLDRKLAPVMQYIAETKDRPVSLRDIVGGIGYIAGLVGLAAYFRFRSEKRES